MVASNSLTKEEKEIKKIKNDIELLRIRLIEKVPDHFSLTDLIDALFGALLIGLTFLFKGALIKTVAVISPTRMIVIVLLTLLILMAQIYFIGYKRVKNKNTRHFGQFLTKRLLSLYAVSLIVSFTLVYLFGVNILAGSAYESFKLVFVLAMPCAIGAAIPSLLRQY